MSANLKVPLEKQVTTRALLRVAVLGRTPNTVLLGLAVLSQPMREALEVKRAFGRVNEYFRNSPKRQMEEH